MPSAAASQPRTTAPETKLCHRPTGLGNVAAEYDGAGNLIARYDHGYGLVSRSAAVGQLAFYTFSAIGNTSDVTDLPGNVLNTYVSDPFGVFLGQSESGGKYLPVRGASTE